MTVPDPQRHISQTRKVTTPNGRAAEVTMSGCVAFGFQVRARCPFTRLEAAGSLGPYLGDYPGERAVYEAEKQALANLDRICEGDQAP